MPNYTEPTPPQREHHHRTTARKRCKWTPGRDRATNEVENPTNTRTPEGKALQPRQNNINANVGHTYKRLTVCRLWARSRNAPQNWNTGKRNRGAQANVPRESNTTPGENHPVKIGRVIPLASESETKGLYITRHRGQRSQRSPLCISGISEKTGRELCQHTTAGARPAPVTNLILRL